MCYLISMRNEENKNETQTKGTEMEMNQMWQTKARGSNNDEYQIYLDCANDGNGTDITTGEPLKTFDEWIGN